ncbi:methyltransferase [Muricoccus aerilatus]|uniref:methyltransferase n=1 Tax=Muricoccus aerilatus TaxID=452982 RepID=UPI0005C13D66|nr:class I SAM-dependent methyltransferase [Roseomonas aerilata]
MSDSTPLPSSDVALRRLVEALRERDYHFITATPLTHARVNGRPGNEEARSLRDVFGWSRPFEPGLLPPELLKLMEEGGVLAREGSLCRSLVRVSSLDGMLFLHSAYPTTGAEAVFFGPDTYRFANAIAAELDRRPGPVRRAVDIGCGAGPGGIVVARSHPGAEVAMVDINDAALRLARVNAAMAGATNARAVNSNLLTGVEGRFDLIVSNPPYLVDPARRAYRHGGGDLGAGLSLAILDAALERLSADGTLILYSGAAVVNGADPFRSAVAARLAGRGVEWSYREMDPDVFGEELEAEAYREADRIAAVVLTVNNRG